MPREESIGTERGRFPELPGVGPDFLQGLRIGAHITFSGDLLSRARIDESYVSRMP